jgi:D-tyrosyl-tRNA(Tyr) deacylase
MKLLIQRCQTAQVLVDGEVIGAISHGLTLFLGVAEGDTLEAAKKLAAKVASLRIFSNDAGKFDLSIREVGGAILLISNFTLCGDARKGARPNFSAAARPEAAQVLVDSFATLLREQGLEVATGRFGADMKVSVENDGPVSLVLEA